MRHIYHGDRERLVRGTDGKLRKVLGNTGGSREPIRDWKVSTRICTAEHKYEARAYLPDSADEAWATLLGLPLVFITWDDLAGDYEWEGWKQGVWINRPCLTGMGGRYREQVSHYESWLGDGAPQEPSYFLGNAVIYDGAKLSCLLKHILWDFTPKASFKNQPMAWMILKREWVEEWKTTNPDLGTEFWPMSKRLDCAV